MDPGNVVPIKGFMLLLAMQVNLVEPEQESVFEERCRELGSSWHKGLGDFAGIRDSRRSWGTYSLCTEGM